MSAPITAITAERQTRGHGYTQWVATIERYGRSVKVYELTAASYERLYRVAHRNYTSMWPTTRREGWHANIYVSDERINQHYSYMAQWAMERNPV